ncbi:MAG: hypothetical protein ABSA29_11975 [Terriglobales bacterium]
MRYYYRAPGADQADANDSGKTSVLTCHDAPHWNATGKEESQQKRIINIRDGKGRYARNQHRQILIHKKLYLSAP